MYKKILIITFCLLNYSSTWAFNCYFTLVKDSCWLKYNLTVKVLEPTSNKEILTVAIPAGKSWVRQSFACEPKQNLMYQAQFTPVIWEAERGKIYSAHEIWALPDEVKLGSEAWNVSVCYPKDFSEVPLPPEATNKCGCDFSTVPAIKP